MTQAISRYDSTANTLDETEECVHQIRILSESFPNNVKTFPFSKEPTRDSTTYELDENPLKPLVGFMCGVLPSSGRAWPQGEENQTITESSLKLIMGCLLLPPFTDPTKVSRNSITSHFVVRNEHAVFGWLDAHPTLYPVLEQAAPSIKHYFPDSQIYLDLVFDHEEEGLVQLIAAIGTTLDVGDALELLDRFYDEWWENNQPYVENEFFFKVRFL